MPRVIGADSAMEIITAGKDKRASDALKLGLVDAVVDTEKLREAALGMMKAAIAGELDWQSRRRQKLSPLTLNKIEATMSFTMAKGWCIRLLALITLPRWPPLLPLRKPPPWAG